MCRSWDLVLCPHNTATSKYRRVLPPECKFIWLLGTESFCFGYYKRIWEEFKWPELDFIELCESRDIAFYTHLLPWGTHLAHEVTYRGKWWHGYPENTCWEFFGQLCTDLEPKLSGLGNVTAKAIKVQCPGMFPSGVLNDYCGCS